MSLKQKLNGVIKLVPVWASEIGLVDIKGLFKAKNVQGALNELKTDDLELLEKINKNTTDLNDNTQNIAKKIDKTAIVNNTSVTEAGFVADARQIKILNDKISSLGIVHNASAISKIIGVNSEDSVFNWLNLSSGTYLLMCSTSNLDLTTELRLYKNINSIDSMIAVSKSNVLNTIFTLDAEAIIRVALKTTTNSYTIYGDARYERLQLIKIA